MNLEDIKIIIPARTESDQEQGKTLADYLEPTDLFETSGKTIIKHEGLQSLAKQLDIVEKKIELVTSPSNQNNQQHVVLMWIGYKGDTNVDNWERGSGEASTLNTGKIINTTKDGKQIRKYVEHKEIDAMYRFAMAEKRAFSRAMKKFLQTRTGS